MRDMRTLWLHAIEAGVRLVNEKSPAMDLPIRSQTKVTRESTGHTRFEEHHSPDHSMVPFRLFEQLQALDEVDQLRKAITESPKYAGSVLVDAGGNSISDVPGQSHWLTNFYILPLVASFLSGELNRKFDPDRAAIVVDELEEFLKRPDVEVSYVAPLANLQGEGPLPLELGVVRAISNDEFQALWEMGEHSGIIDRMGMFSWELCIEVIDKKPKWQPTDQTDPVSKITAIVGSMRLLRGGRVGCPIVMSSVTHPTFGIPFGRGGSSGPLPAPMGVPYQISSADIPQINQLASKIRDLPTPGPVFAGLQRLNFSYERRRTEDQIVDCWIGLESLFLGRDERAELSYRASMRMARLLGRGPFDREWIYKVGKRSYDARSDVVHGSKTPKGIVNLTLFTEEILRAGLRRSILSGHPPRLTELDIGTVRAE